MRAMRILIISWMVLIASQSVTGIQGFIATMSRRPLRQLSYLLLIMGAEGVLMGIGVVALLRSNGKVQLGPASVYLWAWLVIKAAEAIVARLLVRGMTGRIL